MVGTRETHVIANLGKDVKLLPVQVPHSLKDKFSESCKSPCL